MLASFLLRYYLYATHYELMVRMKWIRMKGPKWGRGEIPKQPFYPVFVLNSKGPDDIEEVTMPPIIKQMTQEQIDAIVDTPLKAEFPCHSQSVEHGVKRRRKEETQLACVLQTVEARAMNSHIMSHIRSIERHITIYCHPRMMYKFNFISLS